MFVATLLFIVMLACYPYASGTQEIVVTNPPTITVPNPPPTVTTQSSEGEIVNYAVSAENQFGDPLTPSCDPTSGSLFPPGATAVSCFVTDPGNRLSATDSFVVTVTLTTDPEPIPMWIIILGAGIVAVAAGIGVLVMRNKRKGQQNKEDQNKEGFIP